MINNKSFTLIELLVVIVIIGILAGVIIVSTSSLISKANFAKAQAFSNTVQQELLLNLVSEWTFDNSSNPGEDTWGNNDGVVTGATYQNKASGNCVYGGCYSFDGNDVVTTKLNVGGYKQISASLWIYPTLLLSTKTALGTYTSNTDMAFDIDIYATSAVVVNIKTETGNRINIVCSESLPLNTWNHILFTWNNLNVNIYLNGLFCASSAAIGNSLEQTVTENLVIGAHKNSTSAQNFNGLIDDVRIYNAALTTAQAKEQYIAGLNSLLASGSISKEEYDQRLNNLAQK